MRAISNVHACRIWPAGRRFPTPVLKSDVQTSDHVKPFVVISWQQTMNHYHLKYVAELLN